MVVGTVVLVFSGATYYTLRYSTIGESRAGAPIFWPDHEFNLATGEVAKRFGGVDNFTVFVDGDGRSSSSDGQILQRIEALDRHMSKFADPGAAISVVNLIRGQGVEDSLRTLEATNTRGARIVTKVLNSAVANAVASEGMDFEPEHLYVKEAYVNEGPTMKRFRARAMGRATRINKRTSHITIVVAVKGAKEAQPAGEART